MVRQYGPVYAVGVLLSVHGWVTKRPDESLWSAVAVGIILTGPISSGASSNWTRNNANG